LDLSSKQHKPAFRFDFLIFSASSLYRKIRADNPIFPILPHFALDGGGWLLVFPMRTD
jgi:hypothetical protein